MKIQLLILLFFLQLPLLAQGEEKQYAQVQQEGLKKIDNVNDAFRVFQDEILERKSLIYTLPDGKKLSLGNGDDMASIEKPKILPDDLLKKIIKKQKVFLGDGKLYEGYLFDFNHPELEIEEEKEVNAASYKVKQIRLKMNGATAKSSYPYDPSGLVYFEKSAEKFSNPYIRIIVPGYATAFIEKNAIDSLTSAYDTKAFKEYTISRDDKSYYTFYNNATKKIYQLNKGTLKYLKKVEDGNYKIQGENKQFVIVNGNASIEDIPLPPPSSLNIWMIIAIIELPILLLLLYLFRKRILNMLSRKHKEPIDASESTENGGNWGEMNDATQEDNTYETVSNDIPSKSLKKLKGEILKSIKEHQEKTTSKIERLREEIQSNKKTEVSSLKTENEKLKSEKKQFVNKNEELSANMETLTVTITESNKRELVLNERINRFDGEAIFIDNYNVQIEKLISFFDTIKKIENQLITDINSQVNYTIKQFQSIVFTKYLNHKVTTVFKDWDTILKTIKNNNGLIVDKALIRQIKDKTSAQDQLKGIEWIVVNDLLLSKINRLLILLEEFRNTGIITATNTEFSSIKIEKFKSDVINDMKSLFDVRIADITLFSNFGSYSNIKSVHEKMSYDLNHVELQMGDIKEIKTYGMELNGKTIETIVIE